MLPHQLPELAVKASNEAKTISMVLKYVALVAVAICTVVVCALFIKVSLLPDVPSTVQYAAKNVPNKSKNNSNSNKNEGVYVVGVNIEVEHQFNLPEKVETYHPKEGVKDDMLKVSNNIPEKLDEHKQKIEENTEMPKNSIGTKVSTIRTILPQDRVSKFWAKLFNTNNKQPSAIQNNGKEFENDQFTEIQPGIEIEVMPITGVKSLFNTIADNEKHYKTLKTNDNEYTILKPNNELQQPEIQLEFVPLLENPKNAIFPIIFNSKSNSGEIPTSSEKKNDNDLKSVNRNEKIPDIEIEFTEFPSNPLKEFFPNLFNKKPKNKENNTKENIANETELEIEKRRGPINNFQFPTFNVEEIIKNHKSLLDTLKNIRQKAKNLPTRNQIIHDPFDENFFLNPLFENGDDFFNIANSFLQPWTPIENRKLNENKPIDSVSFPSLHDNNGMNFGNNLFQSYPAFSKPEFIRMPAALRKFDSNEDSSSIDSPSIEDNDAINSNTKSIGKFYNQAFTNVFDNMF